MSKYCKEVSRYVFHFLGQGRWAPQMWGVEWLLQDVQLSRLPSPSPIGCISPAPPALPRRAGNTGRIMYLSPTCYSETQKQQHVQVTDPKLTTSVGIVVFPCGALVQRPSNSKRIITAEHRIWANHSNNNPRIEGRETQLYSQMLKFKSSFTPTEDIPGRQDEG